MSTLPFSQAAENNKQPIQAVFDRHLDSVQTLLEIGSGTAQHATYFAAQYPHLLWQPSDIPQSVVTTNLRIENAALDNVKQAIALDVNQTPWQCASFDAIYTANSLHIMSALSVEKLFGEISGHINSGGRLLIYGPFKYRGEFTTESNARFDLWLKERNSENGIRDFEWIVELADKAGLRLLEDNSMPANNQMLIWQKAELA